MKRGKGLVRRWEWDVGKYGMVGRGCALALVFRHGNMTAWCLYLQVCRSTTAVAKSCCSLWYALKGLGLTQHTGASISIY